MNEQFKKSTSLLWEQIGSGKDMVLATCSSQFVTARTVSTALYEGKLYFITYAASEKYGQLQENKNAALCFESVQLTGTAELLGDPLSDQYSDVIKIMKVLQPDWFDQYDGSMKASLVQFTPSRAKLFSFENNVPYSHVIDFKLQNSAVTQESGM